MHPPQKASPPGLTRLATAELCASKAWPRSAYKSHNAAPTRHRELQLPRGRARRGPPTPRGLQSHVQASLVNSTRARAANVRLVTANVWGIATCLLEAWPLRVHVRLPASSEHAPNTAAALFSANVHTTRLPAPPTPRSLEPRHGSIVAVHSHAPDSPKTPP